MKGIGVSMTILGSCATAVAGQHETPQRLPSSEERRQQATERSRRRTWGRFETILTQDQLAEFDKLQEGWRQERQRLTGGQRSPRDWFALQEAPQ